MAPSFDPPDCKDLLFGLHDCLCGGNGHSTVLARLSETLLLLGRPEQARPTPAAERPPSCAKRRIWRYGT